MIRRSDVPRAFTIIELVVVLAAIGLLLAITVPAVQFAREASRRAKCASQMQELGRALQSYEGGFRAFPPAMPAMPGYPKIGNSWYSPQVRLLPFVEQAAAFNSVNLAKPVAPPIAKYAPPVPAAGSPDDPRTTVVPVFVCPSDGTAVGNGPVNSYRVCTGANTYDWVRGPFVMWHSRATAEFRDGLSVTVGMSEKFVGAAVPASFSRRRDFWYTGASAMQWTPSADQMVQLCGALVTPPPDFYSFAGYSWFYAGYEFTWYNHVATPNSSAPDCAVDEAHPPDGIRATPVSGGLFQASSNHQNGVNCLMMDGGCRFVTDNIDLTIWRAYATVASGEAITDASGF